MKEITADQIFNLHPKIRWAGFATAEGKLVFARMRPNVTSLATNDGRIIYTIRPMLMSGVCDRLVQYVGPLENVVCMYKKVALVVSKLREGYLAITINHSDVANLQEITESLKTLTNE